MEIDIEKLLHFEFFEDHKAFISFLFYNILIHREFSSKSFYIMR